MIPLNIDDAIVLRRTLEELETRIVILPIPITPIDQLPLGSTLEETVDKVNEMISGLNAVITTLNLTNTSDKL